MHVESGACDWSLTNNSSCQLRNASALLTAVKVAVVHVHSQNFVPFHSTTFYGNTVLQADVGSPFQPLLRPSQA